MNIIQDENMTAYIRYRLEKAQETYQAACVLYDATVELGDKQTVLCLFLFSFSIAIV